MLYAVTMRALLGKLLWILTPLMVPLTGIVAAGERSTERLLFLLMGLVYGGCLGSFLALRQRRIHVRGMRASDGNSLRARRL